MRKYENFILRRPQTGYIELINSTPRFARYGHQAVFNSLNLCLVVLGGLSDDSEITKFQSLEYHLRDNVWEIEREFNSPSSASKTTPSRVLLLPIHGHSSVTFGSNVYLFGGESGDGVLLNNIVEYNLCNRSCRILNKKNDILQQRKSERFPNKYIPSCRKYHSSVLIKSPNCYGTDCMLVFGGQKNHYSFLGDVWIYKFGVHKWVKIKEENPKELSRKKRSWGIGNINKNNKKRRKKKKKMKKNTKKRRIRVSIRIKKKKKIQVFPRPRSNHSACFDDTRKLMFIYGGITENYHFLCDLYQFSIKTKKWKLLSSNYDTVNNNNNNHRQKLSNSIKFHPGGRVCSSLCVLPDSRLCLVGGKTNSFPGMKKLGNYQFICFYHLGRKEWSYLEITNFRKSRMNQQQQYWNNSSSMCFYGEKEEEKEDDGKYRYCDNNSINNNNNNESPRSKDKRNRELWFHSSSFVTENTYCRDQRNSTVQVFHDRKNSLKKFIKMIIFGGRSTGCGMISSMYQISIPMEEYSKTLFKKKRKSLFLRRSYVDIVIRTQFL